jgi:hypothetical protein
MIIRTIFPKGINIESIPASAERIRNPIKKYSSKLREDEVFSFLVRVLITLTDDIPHVKNIKKRISQINNIRSIFYNLNKPYLRIQ